MEKLLEEAIKNCDKAEVFSKDYSNNHASFQNAKLHDIDSSFQSGVSLRIIKDGRLGFAYTRNLVDRNELIGNALNTLKEGVKADFDFPATKDLPILDSYDSSLKEFSNERMIEEGLRVCDILKTNTESEIRMGTTSYIENIRIINSNGADVRHGNTYFYTLMNLVFPGSGSGLLRVHIKKKFEEVPDNKTKELIDLYKLSSNIVKPSGGRIKVLFMPLSMIAITWRIESGTNAKSVYEKISPIADKIDQKTFDDKITIYDDPWDDKVPGARAFDDEGVACRPLTLVKNGVLKSFYYDLNYGQKLNTKSTGHGYRTTRWGGDTVSLKPTPTLSHMRIKPGDKSISQLIASLDKGLIVEGCLGAHSGNIPNGDFSIGVSPGFYVENGEIVGRVKDTMVAGNIYETLNNVIAVGDTLYNTHFGGLMPAILCDNVAVATKN